MPFRKSLLGVPMKVLVACEFSGTVRDAFLRRGHAAMLIASAQELAEALRELHDFGEVSQHRRHGERSKAAFDRAAELLNRIGF